ncbi:MAG: creatininase family protein [Bryobacterales bacterium]|nr:creatininase family protein [Bryobacterales bacterium]
MAREAALQAAKSIPVLVAPPLPFGCRSTTSRSAGRSPMTATYYRALRRNRLAAVRSGFRRLFLLNRHGGNHELAQLVALISRSNIGARGRGVQLDDCLGRACGARRAQGDAPAGPRGIFETSDDAGPARRTRGGGAPAPEQRPGYRSRTRQRPYRPEHPGTWRAMDGYTDSPADATAERGALYQQAIVTTVAQAFWSFTLPRRRLAWRREPTARRRSWRRRRNIPRPTLTVAFAGMPGPQAGVGRRRGQQDIDLVQSGQPRRESGECRRPEKRLDGPLEGWPH